MSRKAVGNLFPPPLPPGLRQIAAVPFSGEVPHSAQRDDRAAIERVPCAPAPDFLLAAERLERSAGMNHIVPPLPYGRREMEKQIRLQQFAAPDLDEKSFAFPTEAGVDICISAERGRNAHAAIKAIGSAIWTQHEPGDSANG